MSRGIFDPNGYAVTATEFTFAGVVYKVGDPFPHAVLKVTTFDLTGLWLADLIRFAPPPASQPREVRVEDAPQKPRTKPALRTE